MGPAFKRPPELDYRRMRPAPVGDVALDLFVAAGFGSREPVPGAKASAKAKGEIGRLSYLAAALIVRRYERPRMRDAVTQ
jgi:hypothetical protein